MFFSLVVFCKYVFVTVSDFLFESFSEKTETYDLTGLPYVKTWRIKTAYMWFIDIRFSKIERCCRFLLLNSTNISSGLWKHLIFDWKSEEIQFPPQNVDWLLILYESFSLYNLFICISLKNPRETSVCMSCSGSRCCRIWWPESKNIRSGPPEPDQELKPGPVLLCVTCVSLHYIMLRCVCHGGGARWSIAFALYSQQANAPKDPLRYLPRKKGRRRRRRGGVSRHIPRRRRRAPSIVRWENVNVGWHWDTRPPINRSLTLHLGTSSLLSRHY